MQRQARAWALRTGVLSLFAVVMALLALTDIAHGEADVTLEWKAVRASFVIIIAFHVLALRALWQKRPDGYARGGGTAETGIAGSSGHSAGGFS